MFYNLGIHLMECNNLILNCLKITLKNESNFAITNKIQTILRNKNLRRSTNYGKNYFCAENKKK